MITVQVTLLFAKSWSLCHGYRFNRIDYKADNCQEQRKTPSVRHVQKKLYSIRKFANSDGRSVKSEMKLRIYIKNI